MATYAVVDADGTLEFMVRGTEADAVGEAYAEGADEVFLDQTFSPVGPQSNPRIGPDWAWEMAGNLYMDLERAMAEGIDEAHAQMVGYLPLRAKTGQVAKLWADPELMSYNLLRSNYKTSRRETQVPAQSRAPRSPESAPAWASAQAWGLEDLRVDVKGLSLLPKTLWWNLEGERILEHKLDLCVGASRECFSSCLVYSGRNNADRYNLLLKTALATCVFMAPQAFAQMLYRNSVWHLTGEAPKAIWRRYEGLEPTPRGPGGFVPMVRLNVYSDIPWELVFPDLFRAIPDLQFYDYTKVPRRDPAREGVSNYDLTFSFSGGNIDDVQDELDRRRRVAAVFFNEEKRYRHSERWPLPRKWMGQDIVDGTISDARPYDPSPSVVGLRWIEPKHPVYVDPTGQAVIEEERLGIPEFVSVDHKRVRARRVDVSRFVVNVDRLRRRPNPEMPRRMYVVPVEDVDGSLVTAVVPRDQPGVEASVDQGLVAEDAVLPDPVDVLPELAQMQIAANPAAMARRLKGRS